MNNIKGMSEKTRTLFEQFVSEVQKESFAEGYEAGKSSIESVEEKTPNQQRAELIERAKEFVKVIVGKYDTFSMTVNGYKHQQVRPVFHVNEKKRTVTVLVYGGFSKKLLFKGMARCNPTDVFNAWIGKAIALGRSLQIDIPVEFLKAVQPSETVVGMKIRNEKDFLEAAGGPILKGETYIVSSNLLQKYECHVGSPIEKSGIIIDDTNAQYEVAK